MLARYPIGLTHLACAAGPGFAEARAAPAAQTGGGRVDHVLGVSPLGRFQRREDLTPPPALARPKAASTSSVVSSSDSTTPDGAPGP